MKELKKDELDFSKGIIENIFEKKSADPVREASPELSDEEKDEMVEMSQHVANITGMNNLSINEKKKARGLFESSRFLLELNDQTISKKDRVVVEKALRLYKKSEKILLQFQKKYG